LEELQRQYEEKLATKEDLKKKAELTELRLTRAAKLVSGLAGERTRWEESVKVCKSGLYISWLTRCVSMCMCVSMHVYICVFVCIMCACV